MLQIGKIYKSNNYGEFKILDKLQYVNNNVYFKVKFLNTGYETMSSLGNIINGKVADLSHLDNIIGKVCESNTYGKFKVLSKDESKEMYYKIKFLDTGFMNSVKYINIINGKVKDFLLPTIYNIGYLGENYKSICNDKELKNVLYNRWTAMLSRCYNKNDKWYKCYGELGVRVSIRWHNFSNFYIDSQYLQNYDRGTLLSKNTLQLDKDKLQINIPVSNRVYSKDTCCWLTRKENNNLKNMTN